MAAAVDLVARIPLFAGLSEEEIARIAALAEDLEVGAGTVLTHEGRYEGWFYVVIAGTVQIARGGESVDEVGPGGYFGEIALLISLMERTPRTATVVAETDVRCFVLSKGEFRSVIYEQNIAVNLLHTMARRLDSASKRSEP